MTAADVIRMLLEMDQQVISPRPSVIGRAALLVRDLCRHARFSMLDATPLGDFKSIDLSRIGDRAQRDLSQPTMGLAEENDRLTELNGELFAALEAFVDYYV